MTFAAGLAVRGHEAGRGDLLDVPAARLRSGDPRCLRAEPARRLPDRPRRAGRRGRAHAAGRLRHRLPAHDPEHARRWRRRTRTSCATCSTPRSTWTARSRCAIRAATASACRWTTSSTTLPIGKAELLTPEDEIAHARVRGAGLRPHGAGGGAGGARAGDEEDIRAVAVNARWAKPLDEELILRLARATGRLVTIEDGVGGGRLRQRGGGAAARARSARRAAEDHRPARQIRRAWRAGDPARDYGLSSGHIKEVVRELAAPRHPTARSRRTVPAPSPPAAARVANRVLTP